MSAVVLASLSPVVRLGWFLTVVNEASHCTLQGDGKGGNMAPQLGDTRCSWLDRMCFTVSQRGTMCHYTQEWIWPMNVRKFHEHTMKVFLFSIESPYASSIEFNIIIPPNIRFMLRFIRNRDSVTLMFLIYHFAGQQTTSTSGVSWYR